MAHCTNCYGTSTVEPCDSVGCLSTNYGKCITYSGSNLFCQSGSIATFTFTGTAVAPTVDTTVTASATGGSGSDATFTVIRRAGETTYEVTLDDIGASYEVSDELTIAGTDLGGTSPTNDITITVATLQAVIANGQNLDVIIANLNNRLCLASEASPTGLDYTAFNYSCLRVGGNLEGVGTAITTAEGFVEATAAALCSLNVRVGDVETPGIVVDSYFSGSLTSGTSTHIDIFNAYGAAIGDIDGFIDMTSVNGNPCSGYSFTTKPSTENVADYINWVTNNTCGIYTTLKGFIDSNTSDIGDITTYITGSSSGTIPSSVDTSCLTGGSATSSLEDATDLVISELCSLISTVGGTTNYTVNWNCFTAPYTSNSIFAAQGLGSFTNTTTLQTHLDQTAQALSALNIQFSSDFTVTNGTCGPVISLTGGSSFTCAALASCTLNSIGDVSYIGSSPSVNELLVRNSSGQWVNADLRVRVDNVVGASNSYFGIHNSGNNSIDVNIASSTTNKEVLVITPTPGSWTVTLGPNPHISDLPTLELNYSTGVARTYNSAGAVITNNSGGNLTITNNSSINIYNVVDGDYLTEAAPTNGKPLYFPVSVLEKTSGGTLNAIHNCLIKIHSEATATFNSGSYSLIDLVNIKGSDMVVGNGNYLEVYFGGISWSTI
jgi:hypothetical protein